MTSPAPNSIENPQEFLVDKNMGDKPGAHVVPLGTPTGEWVHVRREWHRERVYIHYQDPGNGNAAKFIDGINAFRSNDRIASSGRSCVR